VIGIAFAALVSAFVTDLITPIIAAIPSAARRCAFCTMQLAAAT
jgi:large-conductance mechanosensitive channel